MNTIVTFILGIVMGAYLVTQATALHIPTFHLPKTLAVDPIIIGFAVIIVLTILSAKGKRDSK